MYIHITNNTCNYNYTYTNNSTNNDNDNTYETSAAPPGESDRR